MQSSLTFASRALEAMEQARLISVSHNSKTSVDGVHCTVCLLPARLTAHTSCTLAALQATVVFVSTGASLSFTVVGPNDASARARADSTLMRELCNTQEVNGSSTTGQSSPQREKVIDDDSDGSQASDTGYSPKRTQHAVQSSASRVHVDDFIAEESYLFGSSQPVVHARPTLRQAPYHHNMFGDADAPPPYSQPAQRAQLPAIGRSLGLLRSLNVVSTGVDCSCVCRVCATHGGTSECI